MGCNNDHSSSRRIQGRAERKLIWEVLDQSKGSWALQGRAGRRRLAGWQLCAATHKDQQGSPSPMTVSTISQPGSSSWANSRAPWAGSSYAWRSTYGFSHSLSSAGRTGKAQLQELQLQGSGATGGGAGSSLLFPEESCFGQSGRKSLSSATKPPQPALLPPVYAQSSCILTPQPEQWARTQAQKRVGGLRLRNLPVAR